MAPAVHGVLQMLDASAWQGYMNARAITERVPVNCRDILLNIDRPHPKLADTLDYNAHQFHGCKWRLSYYHEIDPYVAPDIQVDMIIARINMVDLPWYRFVMVYEANPVIPSPAMLTHMVTAGQRLLTGHPLIVNTYIDLWQHLPADVREFVRTRCQGMLANPSNLRWPPDFPPVAVLQWGKWPLAGALTGEVTDVDANALSDLWAPGPERKPPLMVMVQVPGDAAVWLVGVQGRRHLGNSPDGRGGEFDALKAAGIPLVPIDADGLAEIPLIPDGQWLQGQLLDIHEDVNAIPERVLANQVPGVPTDAHELAAEVAADLRQTPLSVNVTLTSQYVAETSGGNENG